VCERTARTVRWGAGGDQASRAHTSRTAQAPPAYPTAGDEVIVTYELRRPDGSGGCNTEVLTFDEHDQIVRTEVYFGWDLVPADP
jgi:hypothetical protein